MDRPDQFLRGGYHIHFLLYVENYCSYAFLNTRNRKIRFLRIGAVYNFFIRVSKLDVLERLEDGVLTTDLRVADCTEALCNLHCYCVDTLSTVERHSEMQLSRPPKALTHRVWGLCFKYTAPMRKKQIFRLRVFKNA